MTTLAASIQELAETLPPLVSRARVCEILDLKTKSARRLEREGKLPQPLRAGYQKRFYAKAALLAALAALMGAEGGVA